MVAYVFVVRIASVVGKWGRLALAMALTVAAALPAGELAVAPPLAEVIAAGKALADTIPELEAQMREAGNPVRHGDISCFYRRNAADTERFYYGAEEDFSQLRLVPGGKWTLSVSILCDDNDANIRLDLSPLKDKPVECLTILDYAGEALPSFRYLPNLVYLSLDRFPAVTDISSLAKELPYLKYLILHDMPRLHDISPLADLSELHSLALWQTNVHNFAPLRGVALKELHVEFANTVKYDDPSPDISWVRNLPALEYLEIGGNRIKSLAPLRSLLYLRTLFLEDYKGNDLSPLCGLPLETLLLNVKHVKDISPLMKLPSLRNLIFLNCSADLTPLRNIPLTGVYLQRSRFTDLSSLVQPQLRHLALSDNIKVYDLSPLRGTKLEKLLIGHCPQIKDLSPLKGMTSLRLFKYYGDPFSQATLADVVAGTAKRLSGHNSGRHENYSARDARGLFPSKLRIYNFDSHIASFHDYWDGDGRD